MTGTDFRASIEEAGMTQLEFAEKMGVHRTTIARVCQEKVVEPHWAYALAGYLAVGQARLLMTMVKM